MNGKLSKLASFGSINRQQVQLVLVVISLAMLILGIGAPAEGGGI
jgi:hypothetical protein